jgi:hypothetical protein
VLQPRQPPFAPPPHIEVVSLATATQALPLQQPLAHEAAVQTHAFESLQACPAAQFVFPQFTAIPQLSITLPHFPAHVIAVGLRAQAHMLGVPPPAQVCGAVQSAFEQQPTLVATQTVVPEQFRKPPLHVTPQPPPLQAAAPLAGGAGQLTHAVPQKFALVSGWQMPPQLCVPVGHMPLHAFELGMHAPAQSLLPLGHAGTHARPSQLTVPAAGA